MRISDWSSDVCSSDLVVRERADEPVRRLGRPLEHLALVVRAVHHLLRGGDRLDLVVGVAEVAEIAVGDVLQAMTGRADVLVDLEATLQLGPVEGSEVPAERPVLRSEERRAGKEGFRTVRTRGS